MNTPELKLPVVLFNRRAKLRRQIHFYEKGAACGVHDDGSKALLVSMNADGSRGYISRDDLIFIDSNEPLNL